MPKLCEYENCRSRAEFHFCKTHAKETVNAEKCANHLFKTKLCSGYCQDCYIKKFPNDPMTFQLLFKTKELAIHAFIDNRFDGFYRGVPGTFDRGIQINGVFLYVCFSNSMTKVPTVNTKSITIWFNPNKYKCSKTCKMVNPMLYRRLPLLEEEINHQIERIVNCHESVAECRNPVYFIKIDSQI